MANTKEQFLEHSKAKIDLLDRYISRYLNIIAFHPSVDTIEIHDLFCGPGIYEDGGKGSPICFLKNIKDLHYINAAKNQSIPQINCYFNDKEAKHIEALKANIEKNSLHESRFGKLNFSSRDYQEAISDLTVQAASMHLRRTKAFVFIDPFGYADIKAEHIRDLLYTNHTEVLLWLPIQFMYRFEKNKTPESLEQFLNSISATNEWSFTSSAWAFSEQLKTALHAFLGHNYFVDTFRIKKDANTVFALFFFSSHIKGFEKMLEAKWEIDQTQGQGWDYKANSNQLNLFDELKMNPLEESLFEYLQSGEKSNLDIYKFVLSQGFFSKFAG